ncbi:MAG: cytochrome c3 family protein [Ignavibacteriaceae bacterium]
MKQKLVLGALMVLFSAVSFAQTIVTSKHDLSITGDTAAHSTNESQVCIFCHTPHQKLISAKPLWNKNLSAVASYGVYSSSSLNATLTDVGAGGTTSNLCLSCHDGTVAVNSLDNMSSTGTPTMTGTGLTANKISGNGLIGTSLTNDHPINFAYDAALATADGGLKTPVSVSYVDAAHKIPLYGTSTLQCATCHNPHDKTNGSFLRLLNSGSALCITCHNK